MHRYILQRNCSYWFTNRKGCSNIPETWLSLSGTIAHFAPEYSQLREFAERYPDEYRLKEQVDDFVLGICIMRSGGVLDELQEEYSPYEKKFYGKSIVIWSAGTFGQQLMNRIKETNYCNVVGWIDVDYWEYRRCCLDVDPINDIDYMTFDYVIIATVNSVMAESVKANLICRGISENKILTVHCPKEKRARLLQKYLNI